MARGSISPGWRTPQPPSHWRCSSVPPAGQTHSSALKTTQGQLWGHLCGGPRKSWEEGLPRLACRALPAWPYLTCLAPPHPVCTSHLCSCAPWERGSWKEGPQSVTSAKWLHIYQLGFQEP